MNPNVLLQGNATEVAETIMNAQESECDHGALTFALVNALRRIATLEHRVADLQEDAADLRSLVTPVTR